MFQEHPEVAAIDPSNPSSENWRPVTIRHHLSGAWIGYIVGPGSHENLVTIVGRRIFSWRGGRLEFSQLTKYGVRESDRLCEWEKAEINITEGLIELRTARREIVERAKALPAVNLDEE